MWSAIAGVVLCSVLLWAAFSAIPPQVMVAVRRAPPIVVEEEPQCRSAGVRAIQYSNTTAVSDFKRKSYGAFMTFPTTPPFKLMAMHSQSMIDHLGRERDLYRLMAGALKEQARHQDASQPLLVVDAGANHGTYALYAARLGAQAVAMEPQQRLVGNIFHSIEANSFTDQVVVYHNAILDDYTAVHLEGEERGSDGGVATAFPGGRIRTLTLDCIINRRSVAFLKIDVEGNDLRAIRSAHKSCRAGLVQNVIVEFGPPSRWRKVAKQTAADGVRTMQQMEGYGYVAWLAPSQCTSRAQSALKLHTDVVHGVPLARLEAATFKPLMAVMAASNLECYIYWTRKT